MPENQKVAISVIHLFNGGAEIKVEASTKDLAKIFSDECFFVAIDDVNGIHYIFPKTQIQYVESLSQ